MSIQAEGFRFIKRGTRFTWMHPYLVVATDIDCTDMSDDEFEAIVYAAQ